MCAPFNPEIIQAGAAKWLINPGIGHDIVWHALPTAVDPASQIVSFWLFQPHFIPVLFKLKCRQS